MTRMNLKSRFAAAVAGVVALAGLYTQQAQAVDPVQPDHVKPIAIQRFDIDYTLDGTTANQVELWYTDDQAVTWKLYGLDADLHSPITFTARQEGLYGFYVVARNKEGASAPDPKPGTFPMFWCFIDWHRPAVQITGPVGVPADGDAGGAAQVILKPGEPLSISYVASDDNLTRMPINIEYRPANNPAWRRIAADQPNVGSHKWDVPESLAGSFFLRVRAVDQAGNQGVASSSEMIVRRVKTAVAPEVPVRPTTPVATTPETGNAGTQTPANTGGSVPTPPGPGAEPVGTQPAVPSLTPSHSDMNVAAPRVEPTEPQRPPTVVDSGTRSAPSTTIEQVQRAEENALGVLVLDFTTLGPIERDKFAPTRDRLMAAMQRLVDDGMVNAPIGMSLQTENHGSRQIRGGRVFAVIPVQHRNSADAGKMDNLVRKQIADVDTVYCRVRFDPAMPGEAVAAVTPPPPSPAPTPVQTPKETPVPAPSETPAPTTPIPAAPDPTIKLQPPIVSGSSDVHVGPQVDINPSPDNHPSGTPVAVAPTPTPAPVTPQVPTPTAPELPAPTPVTPPAEVPLPAVTPPELPAPAPTTGPRPIGPGGEAPTVNVTPTPPPAITPPMAGPTQLPKPVAVEGNRPDENGGRKELILDMGQRPDNLTRIEPVAPVTPQPIGPTVVEENHPAPPPVPVTAPPSVPDQPATGGTGVIPAPTPGVGNVPPGVAPAAGAGVQTPPGTSPAAIEPPQAPVTPAVPPAVTADKLAEAQSLYQQALAAHRKGDLNGAAALYDKALAADPKLVEAAVNLGGIRLLQKDLIGAEIYYRQAVGADPKRTTALFGLGRVLLLDGKAADATAALRSLLALTPDDAAAWVLFGDASWSTGNKTGALTAWKKASDLTASGPIHQAAQSRLATYGGSGN
ncbi:MAG: Beta-barrel assembly-enhancing protease [Phycisphaerae bacterium]|nr:Beta-barrel assembly-enhancing protease [Phycisphaerae bacterium]